MRKKKNIVVVLFISALMLATMVGFFIWEKKELVITSSTHNEMKYVKLKDRDLGENVRIRFALYDFASNQIEICIALPRSQNVMHYPNELNIYIDGKQQEDYIFSSRTILGQKNIMLLIEDVEIWEIVRLESEFKSVEFALDKD